MDVSAVALVLIVAATLAGATIQGGIGFGMNLVTVPVLALLVPDALPATAVFLGVPISLAMLRHELHALDRTGIAWIFAGRVPGSIAGAWVVATVATSTLQAIIGSVVLAVVVASLLAPPVPVRPQTQLTAGAVSGVTGTAAGIGGPPLALLYQHHAGPIMRSTLAASFFFGTLLSITTLTVARKVGWEQVGLGALLAPFVVGGSVLGRRLHAVLDRGWLRPAVLVFAAISAVVVIVDAAL